MALSTQIITLPAGYAQAQDVALGTTVDQIKSTGANIFDVVIDNTANGAITYVKLFFALAVNVVLGTTAPDWVIPVPANKKITVALPDGPAYPTALSMAAVTTGGTSGTTAPTSSTIVTVLYS